MFSNLIKQKEEFPAIPFYIKQLQEELKNPNLLPHITFSIKNCRYEIEGFFIPNTQLYFSITFDEGLLLDTNAEKKHYMRKNYVIKDASGQVLIWHPTLLGLVSTYNTYIANKKTVVISRDTGRLCCAITKKKGPSWLKSLLW